MFARALFVAAAIGFGLAPGATAKPAGAAGVVPQHGIFVVGKTLGGIGLGWTQAQVKARWGANPTICTTAPQCSKSQPVWLFIYRLGEPLGAGVRFRYGKTVSVFTLGTPGVNSLSAGGGGGWKTSLGLKTFDPISNIYSLYPQATIDTNCSFYNAISMKQDGVTSSFYTSSGSVYGFALNAPGEPVCA